MKNTENKEIDLLKIFHSFLEYKWLILSVTMGFALLGITYALLAAPTYMANATVQVEEKGSGMLSGFSSIFEQESSAETEISVIRSRLVLAKTVDELNLTTNVKPVYSLPIISKGIKKLSDSLPDVAISQFVPESEEFEKVVLEIAENNGYRLYKEDGATLLLEGAINRSYENNDFKIKVDILKGDVGQRFEIKKLSEQEAVENLQKDVKVAAKGKQTGIIDVSVSGENQREIKNIVRSVTDNYLLQHISRNSEDATRSLEFLKNRLPEVREKLRESEESLNQYREENNSVDLNLEARSYLDTLVRLDADLNELAIKEAEISQRYTKRHPAYSALLRQKQALINEKARVTKDMESLPATQKDVVSLTRDLEVDQQIYIQLSNKVQELDVLKAGVVGNVRILDTAQVLPEPIAPNKPIVVLASTLLGFLLALAYTLTRGLFNKGIETTSQVDEIGMTTYATIPFSQNQPYFTLDLFKRQGKRDVSLLSEKEPSDLSVEALRSLRTGLHFAMLGAPNNILMISGTLSGVGKSFISGNLANVIAKTDKRVLIIDADLRRSYLHYTLDVNNDIGMTEGLSNPTVPFESLVTPTKYAKLDIITRGKAAVNPSELLMSARCEALMKWASENYDLVIVDTPPVLMVTDAAIMGRYAGTVLLVGRFGQTKLKEIELSKKRFEQAGVEVKGFILNGVKRKASNEYEYYHYDYKTA